MLKEMLSETVGSLRPKDRKVVGSNLASGRLSSVLLI